MAEQVSEDLRQRTMTEPDEIPEDLRELYSLAVQKALFVRRWACGHVVTLIERIATLTRDLAATRTKLAQAEAALAPITIGEWGDAAYYAPHANNGFERANAILARRLARAAQSAEREKP